jgi:hypothetical protein
MSLPSDLEGDLNLVVLAFWQRHQTLVDTWMPLGKNLEGRYPGLAVYELPVIQDRSRFSRWFIDNGMRAGISDPGVRERTITLYLDKPPFLEAVGISDDSTIHSLLIDRTGQVLWRANGPLVESAEVDLTALLEKLSIDGRRPPEPRQT